MNHLGRKGVQGYSTSADLISTNSFQKGTNRTLIDLPKRNTSFATVYTKTMVLGKPQPKSAGQRPPRRKPPKKISDKETGES